MERARLLREARQRKRFTREQAAERLGVDPTTIARWEKGTTSPQPINLYNICDMYDITLQELGFDESLPSSEEQATHDRQIFDNVEDDTLVSFRNQDLTVRLLHIAWNCSCHSDARYQELQVLLTQELEDYSHMQNPDNMNRRDALKRLAFLAIEMYGLSTLSPTYKHPAEEVLAHCSVGIAACWQMRKGKDLNFASAIITKYIPTLRTIAERASGEQRRIASDVLGQCSILKSLLANHVDDGNTASLRYAQQAEFYSEMTKNPVLQILAVRAQANAHDYADRWEQALQTAEKARYLVETNKGAPIPPLVASYVYAGLANYQGHTGRKQDALHSLGKAHATFFAQTPHDLHPLWVDHNQANLLLHDGLAHFYLGLSKEACISFAQISALQETSETTRIEAFLDQVMTELQREDAPRDMEYCVNRWQQGMQGALAIQSEQRFHEALDAYTAMRAAWPGEPRVKELRELIVHW